jgi:acyl dehydratase
MGAAPGIRELESRVGQEVAVSPWLEISQERIDTFARAIEDFQWIHVDRERAKKSPFGGTIAHGFLTLSLLPFLQGSIPPADTEAYQGLVMGVNYGLDKVRFPAPVKVDSSVRATRELVEVTQVAPNTLQLKQKVTVEIVGEQKPACVAEFLTRLIYS